MTHELLAWLAPTESTSNDWDFTHGSGNSTFVGSSWTREQPDRSRLDVALQEKVMGQNINIRNPPETGEDTDILDSIPTFAGFAANPFRLAFPGVAIAVDTDDAGIIVAKGFGFYRVDENADSRNWNEPGGTQAGDETDFVLRRVSLGNGTSKDMGTLNSIPGRLAIEVNLEDSSSCAAFIAYEPLQGSTGQDFNNDGDPNDFVIRYFRF